MPVGMQAAQAADPARGAAVREALRRSLVAAIPGWYRPGIHLAVPSLFGLATVAVCIALVDDLQAWELAAIPFTYVLSNATEWLVHRDLLHRRSRIAPVLYDRHTPEHHRVYVTDDMAIRDPRELRLVLSPAYGVVLIFLSSVPIAAVIWAAGQRDVALIFCAMSVGYAVAYEWLHLAYHLPPEGRIGSLRLIRALRHHHAVHHDPALMQRWNLNVTVPLWDWVRGTIYRAGRS